MMYPFFRDGAESLGIQCQMFLENVVVSFSRVKQCPRWMHPSWTSLIVCCSESNFGSSRL